MRWSVGRTQSTALGTALYRVAEAVLFGGTWILRVSGRNGLCGRGRGPGSGLLVVMTVKRPSAKRPSRRRGEMIRLAYVLRCLPTRVYKEAEKTRQLVWCEGVWHKERRQVGRLAFRRPSPMYEQPRHPTFSSVVDGTFCTKIFDRRTGGGRGTLFLVIDNAQRGKHEEEGKRRLQPSVACITWGEHTVPASLPTDVHATSCEHPRGLIRKG